MQSLSYHYSVSLLTWIACLSEGATAEHHLAHSPPELFGAEQVSTAVFFSAFVLYTSVSRSSTCPYLLELCREAAHMALLRLTSVWCRNPPGL